MNCPVCHLPLIVVERHNIELDSCLNCQGFWFDEGELELLPQALNFQADVPDFSTYPKVSTKEKARPCPRCHKRMDKISLGDNPPLLLDRCARGDGLWFDASELGQVFEKLGRWKDQSQARMISFLGETFSLKEKFTS